MESPRLNDAAGEQPAGQPPALDPGVLASLRELQNEDEPDLLDELVELFLADAEPKLAALREAVPRGDAETVQKEAHALKGSCANFGAEPMAAVCECLQSAGRSGNLVNASELLALLEAEFERVRVALSAELSTI